MNRNERRRHGGLYHVYQFLHNCVLHIVLCNIGTTTGVLASYRHLSSSKLRLDALRLTSYIPQQTLLATDCITEIFNEPLVYQNIHTLAGRAVRIVDISRPQAYFTSCPQCHRELCSLVDFAHQSGASWMRYVPVQEELWFYHSTTVEPGYS
jgi:hypothetical protein